MILTSCSGLPYNQKLTRGQTRNSSKALLGLPYLQESGKANNSLLAHSPRWESWFLLWDDGKGESRGQAGLGGFVALTGGHAEYPAFAPNTQVFSPVFSDVAVGFF